MSEAEETTKVVEFHALPEVKVSGNAVRGKAQIWLTIGSAGIEVNPFIVEVPGSGPVTLEDICVALHQVFRDIREVVVQELQELEAEAGFDARPTPTL